MPCLWPRAVANPDSQARRSAAWLQRCSFMRRPHREEAERTVTSRNRRNSETSARNAWSSTSPKRPKAPRIREANRRRLSLRGRRQYLAPRREGTALKGRWQGGVLGTNRRHVPPPAVFGIAWNCHVVGAVVGACPRRDRDGSDPRAVGKSPRRAGRSEREHTAASKDHFTGVYWLPTVGRVRRGAAARKQVTFRLRRADIQRLERQQIATDHGVKPECVFGRVPGEPTRRSSRLEPLQSTTFGSKVT